MADVRPSFSPRPGRWLLMVLAAVGPGLCAWAWTRPDSRAYLLENNLDGSPWMGLLWALGSALLVGAGMVGFWRVPLPEGVAESTRTRALSVLAASPLLALIFVPGIEDDKERFTLLAIFLFALAAAMSAHALTRIFPRRGLLDERVERWAPWLLVVLVVACAAMFGSLALVRHQSLGSRIFDLGIFDNLMFRSLHGHFQSTTFLKNDDFTSAHFAPILLLLTPLYALAPGPETLILVQTTWMASAAIPLYRIATYKLRKHRHHKTLGVVLALAWLMHPSMQGVALFDFHALPLAAPLLLWAIDMLERQAWRRYVLFVALMLLVREDVPFLVMGLGLHAALSRGHLRVGALTVLAGVAGLLTMKLGFMAHPGLFMPNTESTYRYANRFSGVIPDPETGGVSDILATLLTNPGYVFKHTIRARKFFFFAFLALPCMGLCWAQTRAWFLMAFGLVFCLLSSSGNLVHPYLHYTVLSVPAMLAAAVDGIDGLLSRAPRGHAPARTAAIVVSMSIASLLAADRFGVIGHSELFGAGYVGVKRSLSDKEQERYAWVRKHAEAIGPEYSVSATNTLGAHFSTRLEVYNFRHRKEADFLVLDLSDLSGADRLLLRTRRGRRSYKRIDRFEKRYEVWRRAESR